MTVERNWRSESFDQLAQTMTGQSTDGVNRLSAYSGDVFSSQSISAQ